ncbi:MAG: cytochrome c [Alphaproteobacteria bacterium]|nr:cytochrome c [Alphaproteobacteria bacterium]
MRFKIALIACASTIVMIGLPARAEDASSARGGEIAKTRCARCHALDEATASPYPGAYPFRKVLERWTSEDLKTALTTGIIASHPPQDETVHEMKLSPEEAADFIAYLQTLTPAPSPR